MNNLDISINEHITSNPNRMRRRIRILGAKIEERINKYGDPELFWDKPEPVEHAFHFKNAAMRRKVQADPQAFSAKMESAFYKVPIYNGIDNRLLKYLQSRYRYAKKLACPEWQAGVWSGMVWRSGEWSKAL